MDLNTLLSNLHTNNDIKVREIKNKNKTIHVIFIETICNSDTINDFLLRSIINKRIKNINDIKNNVPDAKIVSVLDEDSFYTLLFQGFSIISIDNNYIAFETKRTLDSGILESQNEKAVKGPKDAFTENYESNIGLIRKRIRSKDLVIKEFTLGTNSKTKVAIIYIENIAKEELVNKIIKKISNISIDYIPNNNYISELICEKNYIMPTTINTERPDMICFGLMNGKIAIITENTPQGMLIPAFFEDYIHTIDDYYQNERNVSVTRTIRLIAFILSLIIPGLYLALTTFNQETLPISLLINFSIQREGVPFPSVVEAVLLWLVFEILKESDTRIPYVVGTSMSIVGAIVLGDAAATAGIISPIMIIIMAISSISTFLFNDNDMVNAIRIWKLIFILLSSFVGLYGLFIASLLFIVSLCTTKSYNFDYLSLNNKDSIILTKKFKLNKRNKDLTTNTKRR
ncbi:MAG: spore germination protein [Bacilli bacterium]|nr:spore germination protein [Bacilli bacterium]